MNSLALKNIIDEAEREMLTLPQAEHGEAHYFGGGVYIREMRAPAGTMIIGHEHKTEHMNVLLLGRIRVISTDGTTSEMRAPQIYVAGPGRKVGYAITDVVWLNIHATEETDLDRVEEAFLIKSDAWKAAQKRLEAA